ncbi:MAG: ABC transporter permease [Gemmataceae bacterium]
MSQWRAWLALVVLSLSRQARARQMVWIALGLLGLSVAGVAYLSAVGRWGVSHWTYPRGSGVTFPQLVDRVQITLAVTHRDPLAQAHDAAAFGAVRALVQRDVRDADGRPFPGAGFQVFSRTVVFLVFLTFLLPLWSLSFATESIGGERESRSLIWLLTRPIPRWAVYLARFVALLPWALGLNVGGFALLCFAAGPPGRLAFALYWPAVLWASLTFAALFLLIGAGFRRPAVVAILYSFCLEMVLGNLPGYLKRLSVSFYARCMMAERASEYGIETEKPGVYLPVDGTTALAVLIGAAAALVVAGAVWFSRAEYHEGD